MQLKDILRTKRRELGLTQEQVADYLGVTTPAVNKWEKGVACPDLALLPALARLLKTDPNTLLCFESSLSQQEIGNFLTRLSTAMQSDGAAVCFEMATEQVHRYPRCDELLHMTALTLDGLLMMSGLNKEEKRPYAAQILKFYEQTAKCEDENLAQQARYMLAAKYSETKQYGKAQKMLDLLPSWNALDPRNMQAAVWQGQGDSEKAAAYLERKLSGCVQDQQATLCRLVRLTAEMGDFAAAQRFADCARQEARAFELGEYWENIAVLELALAKKDVEGCFAALDHLLQTASKPMSSRLSPLFLHLPDQEGSEQLQKNILDGLLRSLDHDPQYAFLRSDPAFQTHLAPFRTVT